jgi:hypothetical protein
MIGRRRFAAGLFLGWWSIGASIGELLRSLPSMYQLVPTYPCLDLGDGELKPFAVSTCRTQGPSTLAMAAQESLKN